MSEETAVKAIDVVFQSPSRALKIEFQGGEPLLNFARIQQIVLAAEQRNLEQHRDLQFVIATNLALINDEILEFCRAHNVLISTSLDGPKDLHNKNRPRPGGDSYEKAVEGIARARAALGEDRVGALMTTTLASLPRVREIIDEYVRLGVDGIFLRPLSPYGFAVKTKVIKRYIQCAPRTLRILLRILEPLLSLGVAEQDSDFTQVVDECITVGVTVAHHRETENARSNEIRNRHFWTHRAWSVLDYRLRWTSTGATDARNCSKTQLHSGHARAVRTCS